MPSSRCFLFLQGPPGLFWARLGDALKARGHAVRRINLNTADWLSWPRRGAHNYRGSFAGWEGWLADYLEREGVTDILYYADRLPYHVVALAEAKKRGIRVHAIEFGYLRPDWLTMEPEAMGRHSTIPSDPAEIRRLAEGRPDPDMEPRYTHGFWAESAREVSYNLAMVFGRPLYPLYRSDKYYWPVAEYLAWLAQLVAGAVTGGRDEAKVDEALSGAWPFYLVALQLQMDYQIRASTDYGHIEEMLDEVAASFAANAPAEAHLVIKTHPLDCGLEFWPRRVARVARRHGISERVHLVDSKRLAPLIKASRGVILANSTVGLHAIGVEKSVIALGDAVFNIAGLTHQSGLDTFWTAPEPVDPTLARDLRRALAAHWQVRGSFYNPEGVKVAIEGICERLEGE
ncbi:capsule biosynthesis protein [Oceanicella sp. SM1341]|uniref:capsule biosynthesis protein n=1 Tax=Oceanicella sp. SM1341 TaxID=1548889 RepID=UPI000E4D653A|nr:capsular biosynthesis protein [Oceanicella sp. SM1341]